MIFALRRILVTVPLLIAVSLAIYALTDALPGDAATVRFEKNPRAAVEWRENRGLNDPFFVRWSRYVGGIVTDFDFDKSYLDDQPVGGELGNKLQATFELTVFALLIALIVGGAIGILSAVYPRSPIDYLGNLIALAGISMPVFWLGMLLIVFAVNVLGFPFTSNRVDPLLDIDEFATHLYLFESVFRFRFDVFWSCVQNLFVAGAHAIQHPDGGHHAHDALRDARGAG